MKRLILAALFVVVFSVPVEAGFCHGRCGVRAHVRRPIVAIRRPIARKGCVGGVCH